MFGIKWLWKTNRGSNIDTSNFVSKEFLNTTLQDYVNRDLLNSTLSNELANYVSTTSLNNTLNNYVLNSALNTTLSSYVQTNTLNITLQNYVQTSSLSNYVSTNTAQTITGAKTFTEGIIINKNPVPLTLKATDNNKNYIVFKDTADRNNFSLGANSGQTSLEVNRGDLEIETQQENKNISINTGRVKFNRSAVEFGTEINAGYGGGTVKFIPEDTSIKTLQFYNTAPGDNRHFNLLVPEPSVANSPATKNYVDTAISGLSNANLQSQINTLNTFKTNVENSLGYNLRYQDLTITSYYTAGNADNIQIYFRVSTIQNTQFVSAVIHYKNQTNAAAKACDWIFNYGATDTRDIMFSLFKPSVFSTTKPQINNTVVRIFYIDTLNTKTTDPYFIVEEEGK